MGIVKYCQSVFNFVIPSVQIAQKVTNLWKKLMLNMNEDYDDMAVNLCCKTVL